MVRILSKFIVGLLSFVALFIVFFELIGITVFFPFTFVERENIPYHRMQSVRLSVFLTFIYFGIRYIFMQTEKLYPIQFLDIYIKSVFICSLFVFYSMDVAITEYYFVFFFFVVSIILHFGSRKRIRNYFN